MQRTPRLNPFVMLGIVMATLAVMTAPSLLAATLANPTWQFTQEQPDDGWQRSDYDDRQWQTGPGGFGTRGTPGARVGTKWNTDDIWLRKTFEIDEVPARPGLLMHHDEDVTVYINGQKVVSLSGWTMTYEITPLDPKFRSALKPGKNTMAIHCQQTSGGQFIDVHFVDADNPATLPKLKPFASQLITEWGSKVTPKNAWTEYPRPQMSRPDWTNLNGSWEYAITSIDQTDVPTEWAGNILVPFPLESRLSGVQELLGKDEALWYHRAFTAAKSGGKRTLLNFEAVDYRCEAFINGQSVGSHQGGNTPFTFDITDVLRDDGQGENTLIVRVEDATEEWQLRGKQVRSPGGIMYTQVSGIWQTVWLEQVSASHIADLKIHTDAKTGTIVIRPEIEGKAAADAVRVVVTDDDVQIAELTGGTNQLAVTVERAKLWSPAHPHLYGLEVSLLDAAGKVLDQVSSYTGIRSVGKTRDAQGHLRMTLNGEEVFHWGPLDQGWWPDGLLTPPSDEAMLFDIQWLKSAGFNMIRKHIKVEPRRYYYHCDRLGMMVWQDQVSGGHNPKWTFLEPNPQDADWPTEHHEQFIREFEWMIDELECHPSIVVWGPFNEAWSQHRTMDVGQWTVERDPTRLVNIASGGNFWPVGDIADRHSYPHPDFPFDAERFGDYIKVVGEFGGHGYPVAGHLWDAERENWGYGGLPKTKREYRDRYVKSLDILDELRKKGVAAGVYTQTTDVEGEINGLMSYDRKVIKIPAAELSELHQQLFE